MTGLPAMSGTTNEQVCNTLARLCEKWPRLRVMQLIINAVPDEVADNGFYYIENDELMGHLLAFEQKIKRIQDLLAFEQKIKRIQGGKDEV